MKPYQNRIVVKVGTSTLTNELGKSDLRCFDRLACVLSDIQNMGYEVILVSSGAIAVGRNKLKMKTQPTSMRHKQAAAAVGQCSIMFLYDKFFGDYDKTIGQILLNAEDIEQEEKKDNLINTFDALLEMGVIPIVNENDSVSYTEIESNDRLFGDNDMLSSVVAVLCRASKLVIFSDIDGFYNCDPRLHPDAKLIEEIRLTTKYTSLPEVRDPDAEQEECVQNFRQQHLQLRRESTPLLRMERTRQHSMILSKEFR